MLLIVIVCITQVEELLEEYQVDGEHKCGRCGTIVSRKADYLVHVDTHKDFMPWECTICGTRFKIRGSLKEHLRYTHMKGRVPCLKCNKVFATSTLLRQHVKVWTSISELLGYLSDHSYLVMPHCGYVSQLHPQDIYTEQLFLLKNEVIYCLNGCWCLELNSLTLICFKLVIKNVKQKGHLGVPLPKLANIHYEWHHKP